MQLSNVINLEKLIKQRQHLVHLQSQASTSDTNILRLTQRVDFTRLRLTGNKVY
jgi:hypothetical protein